MKLRWLVVLGLVTFVVLAIVSVPASVVLGFLDRYGVSAAGAEGTAWNGRAQMIQVQGINVGALEWDLHALALLTLKLEADVKITRPQGFVQTQIGLRSSESISLEDLTGSLPLAALAGIAPPGWNGTVNLKFAELVVENGWPTSATGTTEILNLTSTAQSSPLSGSYKLSFPAPGVDAGEGVLAGEIVDLGGPLQIQGELELRPDRSYLVSGTVAARPDAPANLADQLQILGPADAEGRRPFSLEGTL
jgi:general secretion pathway protein N